MMPMISTAAMTTSAIPMNVSIPTS